MSERPQPGPSSAVNHASYAGAITSIAAQQAALIQETSGIYAAQQQDLLKSITDAASPTNPYDSMMAALIQETSGIYAAQQQDLLKSITDAASPTNPIITAQAALIQETSGIYAAQQQDLLKSITDAASPTNPYDSMMANVVVSVADFAVSRLPSAMDVLHDQVAAGMAIAYDWDQYQPLILDGLDVLRREPYDWLHAPTTAIDRTIAAMEELDRNPPTVAVIVPQVVDPIEPDSGDVPDERGALSDRSRPLISRTLFTSTVFVYAFVQCGTLSLDHPDIAQWVSGPLGLPVLVLALAAARAAGWLWDRMYAGDDGQDEK